MSELRELAAAIALEASEIARRRRSEGVTVAASKSSIVDVVTHADREVEQLVLDRILSSRPNDGVLGEEGSSVQGSSGLTWVIDPIDGTVNYVYDLPEYAVSIAVVEGDPDPATWTQLAGAVVNAATGEHYSAARGEGATRNGVAIHVAEAVPLELALVGTGFGYRAERRLAQGAVVAKLLGSVRDIRRMGSAALDLCRVGGGRLDAYFESGLQPWDMAAGSLIAAEAGAAVRGWEGPADSRFVAAGHPSVLDALWPLFDELGAHDV